jgi:hypothetical protein
VVDISAGGQVGQVSVAVGVGEMSEAGSVVADVDAAAADRISRGRADAAAAPEPPSSTPQCGQFGGVLDGGSGAAVVMPQGRTYADKQLPDQVATGRGLKTPVRCSMTP